jgi:hypothetical protein
MIQSQPPSAEAEGLRVQGVKGPSEKTIMPSLES